MRDASLLGGKGFPSCVFILFCFVSFCECAWQLVSGLSPASALRDHCGRTQGTIYGDGVKPCVKQVYYPLSYLSNPYLSCLKCVFSLAGNYPIYNLSVQVSL